MDALQARRNIKSKKSGIRNSFKQNRIIFSAYMRYEAVALTCATHLIIDVCKDVMLLTSTAVTVPKRNVESELTITYFELGRLVDQ